MHVDLATTSLSLAGLGQRRTFGLVSTDPATVVQLFAADAASAAASAGVPLLDDRGKPAVIRGTSASLRLTDGSTYVGYILLAGGAPTAVWADAEGAVATGAAPVAVADLASTTHGYGASTIGIEDAGGFTAATTDEAALAEIYQGLLSIQKTLPIPLGDALDIATGAALAVFANGTSTTPGTDFTNSKTRAIRWNNDAAPGAIVVAVPYPQDIDDTALVTFHALVSKVGATVGDATKLTVGAFELTVGALHDADTDFGGDTGAVVGNATSKTVTELTLTLAAVDIHAAPASITLTIKPKAGTLGTDDFLLHACWLEYKPKLLTS